MASPTQWNEFEFEQALGVDGQGSLVCCSPWSRCWERQRPEEKVITENEMVGWHHRLNGHGLSKLRDMVEGREAWHAAVHGSQRN